MKKTVGMLIRLVVFTAVAVGFFRIASGQGTEGLPTGDRTKEYELRGVPVDPEPVANPTDGNPVGGLGPPQIPNLTVPEPATTALVLAGAGLLVGVALRRRSRR